MKTADIRTGFEDGYSNGYKLVAEDQPLIDAPLWWHDKGLMQQQQATEKSLPHGIK